MEIHLIWAQDENGGIGKKGKLPWYISEDLKNFKKLTSNSTIIMGRKTWESLPIQPLPNRQNIVLSSTKQKNVETHHSFKECVNKIKNNNIDKVFIIGGRSIYKLFFKDANFLHITKINIIKLGIDEFFPFSMNDINKNFKLVSKSLLSKDAEYNFWIRKQ